MHILVIGNGFDIAHGLPTRYTDFLKYCSDYNDLQISDCQDENEEFASFCRYNFWLEYFYSKIPDIDEVEENTWIDFEKEVAETIRLIEASALEINSSYELITIDPISEDEALLKRIFDQCKTFDYDENTFDNFVYVQLRKFVRAFELYCLMINKMEVDKARFIYTQRKEEMETVKRQIDSYSHQARNASGYIGREKQVKEFNRLQTEKSQRYNLLSSEIGPVDYFSMSLFQCVLSFNYTNTYERLYGNENTEYCYLHGKAQKDCDKTNIILGIDDELSPNMQSKDFRWIRFKKYYQRIVFKTGSEYKDWFDPGKKGSSDTADYVHIVGHSLDRTDYDVLYEIFDNSRLKIIVYYYSIEDFEDKIQKVIRLLSYKGKNGRDELIRRVHGSRWSIKFVDQYDEKEGLFIRNKS